jgi:hypothetical protein
MFDYLPTMTGYIVIDGETGHQMTTREYDTPQGASGVARTLNAILATGDRKHLAKALGAAERGDDLDLRMEFAGSRRAVDRLSISASDE